MEVKLDLNHLALFECEKIKLEDSSTNNVSKLVGNKIFDLSSSKYKSLKHILEFNIKNKLKNSYSRDFSRIDKNDSLSEELFPEISKRGRKAISLIFNLKETDKKSVLQKILESDKEEFRKISARFANNYMNYKKEVNGVLGIIKFSLITKKQIENFIAIITADFNEVISTDEENAIKFLNKVFEKNFKTIILYPFLVGKRGDIFFVNKTEAKAHQKIMNSDKDIFVALELESPDFPQKILEELYKKNFGSLEEIYNELGEDYSKKSYVTIEIGDSNFKISFNDFIQFVKLIYEEEGEGIFIQGKEVHAKIGKSDLLYDQRIKKLSLKDLSKEFKNNLKK